MVRSRLLDFRLQSEIRSTLSLETNGQFGADETALQAAIGITSTCENALGDINGDGFVNLLDVNPFVDLLSQGVFQCEADLNQDSAVNLLDVQLFVGLLAGG